MDISVTVKPGVESKLIQFINDIWKPVSAEQGLGLIRHYVTYFTFIDTCLLAAEIAQYV